MMEIVRGQLLNGKLHTCLAEAENALLWQALKTCREAIMLARAPWNTANTVEELGYAEKRCYLQRKI